MVLDASETGAHSQSIGCTCIRWCRHLESPRERILSQMTPRQLQSLLCCCRIGRRQNRPNKNSIIAFSRHRSYSSFISIDVQWHSRLPGTSLVHPPYARRRTYSIVSCRRRLCCDCRFRLAPCQRQRPTCSAKPCHFLWSLPIRL